MRAQEFVHEVNAPDELSIPESLIQRFTSAGWQIFGEGRDQLVLGKPGARYVLKIVGSGSAGRQQSIKEYVQFFRQHQRNPHFPRILSEKEFTWEGQRYYAYTQEMLQSLPGDEAVLDYLEYAMGELGYDQEPDFNRIPPGLSAEQIEGLIDAVDELFGSGMEPSGFDLSNVANIMVRPGTQTLVIVDPFSDFAELSEGWKQNLATGALAVATGLGGYFGTKQSAPTAAPQPAQQAAPKTPKDILIATAKSAGLAGTELAAFLAQAAHETMNFAHMEERGSPEYFRKKYESPRKARILGNKQAGDGERYKGRGFVQLTGRYNYTKAGQALGIDLVNNPGRAADPETAARIALWYWSTRVAPRVQDFTDTHAVTKKINPGMKHKDRREQQFSYYQDNPHESIDENFADGKKPGRKGLSRRVGIPKKPSLSQLEKIAKSSTGERRRMAQWQLNMRRGKAKKNK